MAVHSSRSLPFWGVVVVVDLDCLVDCHFYLIYNHHERTNIGDIVDAGATGRYVSELNLKNEDVDCEKDLAAPSISLNGFALIAASLNQSVTHITIRNDSTDKTAADQLMNYANQNFPELLKALVTEIADMNKPIQVRQMASLFFKNQLNGASEARQVAFFDRWESVDVSIRNTVKDILLQALITSQEPIAAKFISIACSEIAAFDVPRDQWNVFVKTLSEAIDKGNESVQIACLEGLGNTFDRIEEVRGHLPDRIPELPTQVVDEMLSAVIKGVHGRSIDHQRAALNALNKSLGTARQNFERKPERDLIMKAFQDATICQQDHEVRRLGFCCLDNTAFMYYEFLLDYMKAIFDITSHAIKNETNEVVKVQAVEFWVTVASVETGFLADARDANNSRNFCESAKDSLVPDLLMSLTTHKDESDEDEYDFRHAGAVCLEAFSETIGPSIIPCVVPFVEQNIHNTDWRFKDAAIVAFMSILNGNSTSTLGNYIREIVPLLAGSTQDANEIVRDSSLHCLASILKLHVEAMSGDHFEPVITALIARLVDTPKVASSSCTALFALFSFFKKRGLEKTNALSSRIANIAELLLKALDRDDGGENNLRLAIAGTLAELVDAAAIDVWPFLRELVPHILQRIQQVFNAPIHSNEELEQKDVLLATFTGVVISLFQKLNKDDVAPHVERVLLQMQALLRTENLNSHIEVWMLVAAVANTIEDDFAQYLPVFMPELLKTLAASRGNSGMCTQAITTVADLASAVSEHIQPYCDDIVGALNVCLADEALDKSCKPMAISCFGDIAFAISTSFAPYLQSTALVLMQASQATANVNSDDIETIMFFNDLRAAILEAYTGIIYAFADIPPNDEICTMVAGILQFLEFIASPASCSDTKVITKSVSLLGDVGKNFPHLAALKNQNNVAWAMKLLQDARATQERDAIDGAAWTESILSQIFV